jgi:hypothetical protein
MEQPIPPRQVTLTLTQGDRLQLFMTLQGLKVASESKGQMHLTNPRLVRASAIRWLDKVGVKATSRTRWETLHATFKQIFGEVIRSEA